MEITEKQHFDVHCRWRIGYSSAVKFRSTTSAITVQRIYDEKLRSAR